MSAQPCELKPMRYRDYSVDVPIKFSVLLPSGARYTVIAPCGAWGCEDIFGQTISGKDRRRSSLQ